MLTASVLLHVLAVAATSYGGLWLTAGPYPAEVSVDLWLTALPLLVVLRVAGFLAAGVFLTLWRYTSIWDLRNLLIAVGASSVAFALSTAVDPRLAAYPAAAVVCDAMLLVLLLGGARLTVRLAPVPAMRKAVRRVLIFGAGDAGELIAREMKRDGCYEPVGFIDDDPRKRHQRIHGVPVIGSRADVAVALERTRPDELLVAMPSAQTPVLRSLVRTLEPFKLPIRTLPSLRHLMNGQVTVGQIHDLAIEDLLRRNPVGLDPSVVRQLIAGRRILVTGAGGSIGSELCRQIASVAPASLVMVDRYENGLHEVACDLADRPFIEPVIADVTDARRLHTIFARARPELVFHAAAHKHVPLMEFTPCEAIKNNVIGTRLVAEACAEYGTDRFVFISTDKAVQPSSVMGATKRVAELVVQQLAQNRNPRLVTVRFGNVLGSNGSVVPRFLGQIRSGGPVTVTHPEVRRYFMLIPEAVQLVLHAAAVDVQGTTCVLELGEQIKVVDLARHLIRLAGFVPEEEIPIVFTGLRPGEKLSEELVAEDEQVQRSPVPEIVLVTNGRPPRWATFKSELLQLEQIALGGDDRAAIAKLRELVPAFHPSPAPMSASHAMATRDVAEAISRPGVTGPAAVSQV